MHLRKREDEVHESDSPTKEERFEVSWLGGRSCLIATGIANHAHYSRTHGPTDSLFAE